LFFIKNILEVYKM